MRRLRPRVLGSTALGVLLLTAAGRAAAQGPAAPAAPAAPPAAVADAPAAVAPPTAPSDDRADEAWTTYHNAFAAMVAGDLARARLLLDSLVRLRPEHPAAARARSLVQMLPPGPSSWSTTAGPPVAQARDEQAPAKLAGRPDRGTTNAARAELIVFQTLHGVFAGFELCRAVDCVGPRQNALSLMTLGGLGLGVSIAGTVDGIRPGDMEALDSGVFWGAWNGLGVAGARGSNGNLAKPWTSMLVGQGLGLGAGGLVALGAHPSAGQVALTGSVGLWTTAMMGFGIVAFGDNSSSVSAIWVPLLVAGDAGLVVGGVLVRGSPVSRARSALIDIGGVLGMLLGGLIASGADDRHAIGVSLMLGTSLGLTAATIATSDWDRPGSPPPAPPRATGLPSAFNLTPMPISNGGSGLSLAGRF